MVTHGSLCCCDYLFSQISYHTKQFCFPLFLTSSFLLYAMMHCTFSYVVSKQTKNKCNLYHQKPKESQSHQRRAHDENRSQFELLTSRRGRLRSSRLLRWPSCCSRGTIPPPLISFALILGSVALLRLIGRVLARNYLAIDILISCCRNI